jgi:hypothetical protein
VTEAWEQQPGEHEAAYARFAVYLGLGFGRTLNAAYRCTRTGAGVAEGDRRCRAPGSWQRESVRWRWKRRAKLHDAATLRATDAQAVAGHLAVLEETARRTLRWVRRSAGCSDPGWPQLVETIKALGNEATHAAIEALCGGTGGGGDAAGAGPPGGPGERQGPGGLPDGPGRLRG